MFATGEKVWTPFGTGEVAYQRLGAPDYRSPEAVSVVLDEKKSRPGYEGTIVPAEQVEHTERPVFEPDCLCRFCSSFQKANDDQKAPVRKWKDHGEKYGR